MSEKLASITWRAKEKAATGGGCDLGFELMFLAPLLTRLTRLRKRA